MRSKEKMLAKKKEGGFTLIELMIYTALTAIIVGLFGAILITVTRIQGQQNSSVQIAREVNFLLNSITGRIRDAVEILTPPGDSAQLSFRTNTYPGADTLIELSDDKVFITEDGQAAAAISPDRIVVDTLNFSVLQDPVSPSSTTVVISITASFDTSNPLLEVTRSVQTSVSPLLLSQ